MSSSPFWVFHHVGGEDTAATARARYRGDSMRTAPANFPVRSQEVRTSSSHAAFDSVAALEACPGRERRPRRSGDQWSPSTAATVVSRSARHGKHCSRREALLPQRCGSSRSFKIKNWKSRRVSGRALCYLALERATRRVATASSVCRGLVGRKARSRGPDL